MGDRRVELVDDSEQARMIHRCPRYVLTLCDHLLKYVNQTYDLSLKYVKCAPGNLGDNEDLQIAKGLATFQIFSDASFGPLHERCKSISGCLVLVEHAGGIVAWDSQSQPFISQSTAEAEVISVSYNLAYQVGEGVSSWLPTKQLYCDSSIAVIANQCGPWRTRRLRLRSSKLRELVQDPEQPWSIRHHLLVADGLTKVLLYQSYEKFRGQLRMQSMMSPVIETEHDEKMSSCNWAWRVLDEAGECGGRATVPEQLCSLWDWATCVGSDASAM